MTDQPFRASKASGVVGLILLTLTAGLFIYWRTSADLAPGDYEVKKGNYRIEDGQYEDAIKEFTFALEKNPNHVRAHHGMAVTFMQMGNVSEAVERFSTAIGIDPAFAVAYADRGIALDRIGRHEEALADYRKALDLDPDLEKGPGYIWRFLHNVAERPPTISDRADYIEEELKKPEEERLLALPELDEKQRMYKK